MRIDTNKLQGFIEVLVPTTVCNIKCHYCYVVQHDNRTLKKAEFNHSPKEIAYALRPERFGGVMYISFCGAGETLSVPQMPEIAKEVLMSGNFVNITSNGTMSHAIDKILDIVPQNLLCHLNFSFSLHWLELKKYKLVDKFFNNIRKVRDAGCSFVLQMQHCDEYEPYYDEIWAKCLEEVKAQPQVVVTRRESTDYQNYRFMTDHTDEIYHETARCFDSPLFELTFNNFKVNRNRDFCFAGKWSYVLNLSTGILRRCYCSSTGKNIFTHKGRLSMPPVGYHCGAVYCTNASHFIALGVMPSCKVPSYAELRNRVCNDGTEWYQPTMKFLLSQKLYENHETSFKDRITSELGYIVERVSNWMKRIDYLIRKLTRLR